ncbi:hypothetical protein [Calidifontibacter terrae]
MTRGGMRFDDLGSWQQWQRAQRRPDRLLRAIRRRRAPAQPPAAQLHLPTGPVQTLVVVDLLTPSCRAAGHAPLAHLDPRTTAVLTSLDQPDLPATGSWERRPYTGIVDLPSTTESVLSLGSYLDVSGPVAQWAKAHDRRFCVAQHGLLTPWSPPAAAGDHLLAWTADDADYWSNGRSDVTTEIVGSELLWQATQLPPVQLLDQRPVLLGQLHGTELPRRQTFRTYWDFARAEDVDYRPHPNETDALSRAMHAAMRRGGISFESSGRSLSELGRPVVSIFSTGTLEAAHRGLPSWVAHPDPPTWVRDFWRRYELSPWGEQPTAAWHSPSTQPAAAVAAALERVG